ncbi:UNVERIFIED_CONTAM: cytochrome [Sesamum latifolium]|uniref:Cytochrome n=1 Tax=Sesamum latifolium TaxID=2727402 RepID=A0AAW2TQ96_9LAMI
MDMKLSSILASIFTVVSIALVAKVLNWVWFRPKKLEKLLRQQGLNGNPYRLFLGDMQDLTNVLKTEQRKTLKLSDDLLPHILPYYHNIIDKYGKHSFVWFGPLPRVNVADPELIKEILSKPGLFHKPFPEPIGETIVGGLLYLEDERWAKHRKIINQAFHMEKLKNMIPAMFLSCSKMIEKWEASISGSGSSQEIDVWPYLQDLTGDVISRTAFGRSYEEGRRIFELQTEQVELFLQLLRFSFIPGWRYFPTKANRKLRSIAKEIQSLLRGIISQREQNMIPAMLLSCSKMIEKWEALLSGSERSQEIDVWPYLEDLSGDVISRTAFGSSYAKGRKIFELQKEQVKLVLHLLQFSFIPGWRYFPTKANRRLRAITKQIQSLLRDIINQREKAMERGEIIHSDLLSILMESNLKEIQEHGNNNVGLSTEDVIEECKLFYFAGSETTSTLLVWTMVLLSKHQDWQVWAREEVLQVFGKKKPTFDGLQQLKTVAMILQEVLRLYPPVPFIARAPTKTVTLGSMTIPVGVQLTLLIGLLHHDPKIWGDDVKEFKPERFSEGISSAAKAQYSFAPFSSGPRVCIGHNFAMIEAKMALAMILQHFSFELSSSYLHAPFPLVTLQPRCGVPLILQGL